MVKREKSFQRRIDTLKRMIYDQEHHKKETRQFYFETYRISSRFFQACEQYGILKKQPGYASGTWQLELQSKPTLPLIKRLFDIERSIILKLNSGYALKRSKEFIESADRAGLEKVITVRPAGSTKTPIDNDIIEYMHPDIIPPVKKIVPMSNIQGLFNKLELSSVSVLMELFASKTSLDEILKITEIDSMEVIKVAKSVGNVVDTKYIIDFYKELFEF